MPPIVVAEDVQVPLDPIQHLMLAHILVELVEDLHDLVELVEVEHLHRGFP